MSQKKFVIIGGGIAGLMIARFIRAHRDPKADITIIERESHFGGQYSCVDYGSEGGRFDHGMHIFYETCIAEADTLFTSIFPESEWNILEQNWKDAAGIHVHGRLQTGTPWVDLRFWPVEKRRAVIADILLAIESEKTNPTPVPEDASGWLLRHYGRTLTDEVYSPILRKLYYHEATDLARHAIKISPLNRVVLFDEEMMLDLMKSDALRLRIGYPDQFTLPPYRNNNQRGFYPKQFGFYHAMDRLREIVEAEGTRLVPNTTVDSVTRSGDRITSLRLKNNDGQTSTLDGVDEIYWTSGLPSLAKQFGVNFTDLKAEMRPAGWYVHFQLAEAPAMDRLYYFYSFEPDTRSFRITNYASYCPAAVTERGYPLCVEFWSNPGDTEDKAQIIENATRELEQFGIIKARSGIRFSNAERVGLGAGVPLPTLINSQGLAALRTRIRECGITNLRTAGVMAEPDVFFVPEVLTDAWHKVLGTA
jgi:protoporphyrinogen oxidase